jgi:hypothetical protein
MTTTSTSDKSVFSKAIFIDFLKEVASAEIKCYARTSVAYIPSIRSAFSFPISKQQTCSFSYKIIVLCVLF